MEKSESLSTVSLSPFCVKFHLSKSLGISVFPNSRLRVLVSVNTRAYLLFNVVNSWNALTQ
jgi:hypothetical protein